MIVASERQIRANRANATRSTGPRTATGKAASRLNALKHGVLARQGVLPGEDAAAYTALRTTLFEELEPVGIQEELQVDRVVTCTWRLQRLLSAEVGIFVAAHYGRIATEARTEASRHISYPNSADAQLAALHPFHRGEPVIDSPDAHGAALQRAEEAEAMRDGDEAMLGRTFVAASDALLRLARYEAHIERLKSKALDELQRLRAARYEPDVSSSGHPTAELDPAAPE